MNSYYHSRTTAKKYGGKWEDYMEIHTFIDSSKSSVGDVRHRAMLHSAWGIFMTEQVFGVVIKNSLGTDVPVRLIAEGHILEDLGFIPSMEHWLKNMRIEPWMSGTMKRNKAKSISINLKE